MIKLGWFVRIKYTSALSGMDVRFGNRVAGVPDKAKRVPSKSTLDKETPWTEHSRHIGQVLAPILLVILKRSLLNAIVLG